MTGNEIATRADIEQIHQRLDNLFTILSGMQSNAPDRELTLDQAAAFLSVSTATVKRKCPAGIYPGTRKSLTRGRLSASVRRFRHSLCITNVERKRGERD